MKKLLSLFALLLAALLPAGAQTPAPAAVKSQADLDYEAVQAIYRTPLPAGVEPRSKEGMKLFDEQMRRYSTAGRAFGARYPTDPRRYDFYVQSSFTRPWFIVDFKPEFAAAPGERNLVVDQPAIDTYLTEQAKLLTEVIEAPDASDRHRGGGFFALLADARGLARSHGTTFDITAFRPLVDRVVAKFPDARAMPVVEQFVDGLRQKAPAEAAAYETGLQDKPALVAVLKARTEERRAAVEAKEAGIKRQAAEIGSIRFTAADGREVDIAKLKGKVVLVDFWATWCGPCVAELPNVIANYNKYHAQGFEVVGITLENPGAAPKDTPEQTAAKLAKAREKMLEFTVKNAMPWPQYFDGKWWKNDYAVKFGIDSIPAMFLLDQNGAIASTEARGPKLEAEIKRLLKL